MAMCTTQKRSGPPVLVTNQDGEHPQIKDCFRNLLLPPPRENATIRSGFKQHQQCSPFYTTITQKIAKIGDILKSSSIILCSAPPYSTTTIKNINFRVI